METATNTSSTPLQRGALGTALGALVSDSAVYLVGSAVLGLGNFVLIPLYTRSLAPAEFGVYALVDIAVLIVVLVTQLRLDVAYLKVFAETDHPNLLGSVLIAGTATAILGGAAIAAAAALPFGQVWLQTTSGDFAWTLLPIVVLENLQGLLLSDLRARRRPVAYCTTTVVRLLGVVLASLWFLTVQHRGVYGIFLGRLVGDLAAMAALLLFSHSAVKLRFSFPLLKPMLRFGLPLTWAGLMMLMLDATGRFFLSRTGTLDEVGYYAAAIKVSGIFQMFVTQPFAVAWGGLMFQVARSPEGKMTYSKVLTYASALSLAVALGMVVSAPTLFAIFTSSAYAPALTVFPIVVLIRAFGVLEHPAAIGIFVSGRTKWFAFVYSGGLAASLLANYLFVGRYGMFGAAWAWLLGWVFVNSAMLFIGQRLYPLDFDWKLLAIPSLPWILLLVGPRQFAGSLSKLQWPIQTLLAVAVVLSMFALVVRDFRAIRRELSWRHAGD